MLKNLFAYLQSIFTLSKDVERLDANDKKQDERIVNLMLAVQRLSDEVKGNAHFEASEREKLILQLRIQVMELERRLSAGSKDQQK